MSDKNEDKVVTNQSKNNKRRRFRPKNKPKQEGETTEQTSLASKSVIDNFFAAEQAETEVLSEPKSQNSRPKKQRNNKNQNKNEQNGKAKEQKPKQPQESKNNSGDETKAEVKESKDKPKKAKKPKKNLPAKLNGNEQWQQDIANAMVANKAVHELRLEPMKYLNSSEHKIRITPLGGLGEIGGNMTVFETQDSAIIVDIGMSFPSESMHGVDILIPDFDYVRKIKDKIKGVIITHAHEDHIGAVPYFYKEFKFPIYATPLPLGMINNKFEEHGLKQERSLFRSVEKRKPYLIGDFEVE